MEKKWYAIRVITGTEKKTKKYIEHEINVYNLTEQVSNIIIPIEKVRKIVKGKAIIKEKCTMPGYILIEALLNGEIKHIIKGVPGVLNFVGSGGKEESIKTSEIERILGKMDDSSNNIEFEKSHFGIGESVKIIDGPFTNFNATVQENLLDKNRLKVIVKIFGRETPMELSYNQVDKEY